jgi:hypothetical protein
MNQHQRVLVLLSPVSSQAARTNREVPMVMSPSEPPSTAAKLGSSRRALSERVARVAQPPSLVRNGGNPKGAARQGRLFFGNFLLATQKKVTSRRSATGELKFSRTPSFADRVAAAPLQIENSMRDYGKIWYVVLMPASM